MDSPDISFLENTIDKTQIPPINQKRIVAFVNHFIISTCSFLNDFIVKCETKFINFESKLQKVEASLIIIESKLSSISGLAGKTNESKIEPHQLPPTNSSNDTLSMHEESIDEVHITASQPSEEYDKNYEKYKKMVQVGVPIAAVRIKVKNDGLDVSLFDSYTVNKII